MDINEEQNEVKEEVEINKELLNIPNHLLKEKELIAEEVSENAVDYYTAKNKMEMYRELFNHYGEISKEDNDLKKKYAKKLLRILVIQLIVLDILFILVGAGKLNFSDTTFNLFITAGIAEIFTLVTIIVKYLFSDNLTKLMTIILSDDKKNS